MNSIDPSAVGMDFALHGLRQRGYHPGIVIDVGASDGSWTRHAQQVWPDTRFLCFEPLFERRAALEVLQRESDDRVQLFYVGLGDEEAELSLGVSDTLWESSFAYGGASSRTVPVRTLNNMLAQELITQPSMMKLDVQGFERRVLKGASDLLPRVDVILMECSFFPFCEDMSTIDESIGFMAERGFVPYEFMDFLRRPLDGAMGQCDILFVKKGHALVQSRSWL